jgi:hypothetical protein
MNIIMQCIYSNFEDPNIKEILLELHGERVFSKCEHIIELDFYFIFQNLFFLIYLKSQWQKSFKIQCLMHLRSKIYKTNSI